MMNKTLHSSFFCHNSVRVDDVWCVCKRNKIRLNSFFFSSAISSFIIMEMEFDSMSVISIILETTIKIWTKASYIAHILLKHWNYLVAENKRTFYTHTHTQTWYLAKDNYILKSIHLNFAMILIWLASGPSAIDLILVIVHLTVYLQIQLLMLLAHTHTREYIWFCKNRNAMRIVIHLREKKFAEA